MTVAELIQLLKTYPQDLSVVYCLHSEQCLMEADDLDVAELCYPRRDGWVQDKRPDMPSKKYLRFPGN